MILTLHSLKGWFYTASVAGGPKFELGVYDVDDWADEHDILSVIDLSGD